MQINTVQQSRLNSIVKSRQPNKQVFLDFDGIFSSVMLYNATEKFAKSVQYSARYAIEMLRFYGFEVYIITGDQSGSGFDITNKILERIPVNSILYVPGHSKYTYLKENYDINKIFYAGDDLYDMSMLEPITLTTQNAFAGINKLLITLRYQVLQIMPYLNLQMLF
jgi:3-deoxy-D-manno-octulosonate 8-phosphate phosphatase KdsC-like HAD superfamily phosphatase